MTTLIAVYQGATLIGRCDARCYAAKSRTCKCVCFGANHGAGYTRALQQTQRHGQVWLTRYLEERELSRAEVRVTGRGLTQLEMQLEDSGLPSMRVMTHLSDDADITTAFWTVHLDPIDRPGMALARRWHVAGGQVSPDRRCLEAPTVEQLRSQMPSGLVPLSPHASDPESIHEVWVPADRAGRPPTPETPA